MKKIFSIVMAAVLIITGSVFIQSCSNKDSMFLNSVAVDSQGANMIALEYLELVDNQYVLNLSKEDAIKLGISRSEYRRM